MGLRIRQSGRNWRSYKNISHLVATGEWPRLAALTWPWPKRWCERLARNSETQKTRALQFGHELLRPKQADPFPAVQSGRHGPAWSSERRDAPALAGIASACAGNVPHSRILERYSEDSLVPQCPSMLIVRPYARFVQHFGTSLRIFGIDDLWLGWRANRRSKIFTNCE